MKRILVIGDVMIDRHLYGEVYRISPEAPVPIIDLPPANISISLGAAANVAAHITSAGIECVLLYKSFVDPPNEYSHDQFKTMCLERGIICHPLYFNNIEHTVTIKERVWAGTQQVCRIDRENRDKPDGHLEVEWIKEIYEVIDAYSINCIVFSDYDKGTLTDDIILNVANKCKEKNITTILDPKRPTFYNIKNLTVVKPNAKEVKATNHDITYLSDELGETYLVSTLGKDGMIAFRNGQKIFEFPSLAKPEQVLDVCGCGDTVTAVFGLMLYNGATIEKTIEAASKAAAISIQHRGCYVPSSEEMKKVLS